MTKCIIINEIKIQIITFNGQGAFSSKILKIQAKGLLKVGTYCGGGIKKEMKDMDIW